MAILCFVGQSWVLPILRLSSINTHHTHRPTLIVALPLLTLILFHSSPCYRRFKVRSIKFQVYQSSMALLNSKNAAMSLVKSTTNIMTAGKTAQRASVIRSMTTQVRTEKASPYLNDHLINPDSDHVFSVIFLLSQRKGSACRCWPNPPCHKHDSGCCDYHQFTSFETKTSLNAVEHTCAKSVSASQGSARVQQFQVFLGNVFSGERKEVAMGGGADGHNWKFDMDGMPRR